MDKINFENGTLLTPAKVTIDGVDHIVTPAERSGNTPFSAHVMNLLQEKIEKSVVAVNSTEPTTNEKVWIKKGKNLYNKNSNFGNVLIDENGVATANNVWTCSNNIKVKGNIEYTLSWTNINGQPQIEICEYKEDGTFIGNNFQTLNTGVTFYTMTLNSNTDFVKVAYRNDRQDNVQFEQGSQTTYEPYIEKGIYVKNDNGAFEKFSLLTYETNIIELDSSVISGGTLRYEKTGNLVILYFEAIKCINPPSGIWKDMEIAILPGNLRPKNFIVRAIGRSDNNGKMCILNVSPSGRVYVTDRGTGDLSSEAIVGQVIFVSA